MHEQVEQSQIAAEPEHLPRGGFVAEVLKGIGITSGLGLLWAMESARNAYFRLLDRLNVKPRRRRASAFPPGKPRTRSTPPEPGL